MNNTVISPTVLTISSDEIPLWDYYIALYKRRSSIFLLEVKSSGHISSFETLASKKIQLSIKWLPIWATEFPLVK